MRQFLNAMNALDRPDLAFWTNLVFVLLNVLLNLVLIWSFGWVGAAIASLISAAFGMMLSYLLLRKVVTLSMPVGEISRQAVAATGMGAVVFGLDSLARQTAVIEQNVIILLILVGTGAAVYVAMLFTIAPRFRRIVDRNLPVKLL